MNLVKTALIAVTLPLMAGSASAAILSLSGTGYSSTTIDAGGAFDLVNPTYDALTGGVGDPGDPISFLTGSVKNATNGLSVSRAAKVTFTYLGSEAGFTNRSVNLLSSATIFLNNGSGASSLGDVVKGLFGAGLLAFAYQSGDGSGSDGSNGSIANNGGAVHPNPADIGIAFSELFNNDRSILVFFDDSGADVDRDWDDLAMRIDVAPIPVPAAGVLLAAALGGLGLAARRKRARA
jgi:hypothetical protein